MDIPNSDIVIPAVIISVCLLIVWLTFRLTRQRTKGWELDDLDENAGLDDTLIDIDALDAWHRDHGRNVTAWIDSHEETLDALSRTGLQLDLTAESPTLDTALDVGMREAITAHPTPAMRAQLSAMTVAAEATVVAVRRSDYPTAEKQHLTYIEYRDQWLYRLRQFSPNDAALGEVTADANRHGADWVLRPVPDATNTGEPEPPRTAVDEAQGTLLDELSGSDSSTDGGAEQSALVTDLGVEDAADIEDPWQITRPRRSRRRRRKAG